VKVTPSWKGGPLLEDKEAGWSFKPRGRIQYDVGFVDNPDNAIVTRNLGFNTRVRRIRLGAEGTIPGGFGYKFEMDFANAGTAFGDAIITYAPANKPFNFTIGNHESLDGLEQISSSRFISFLERSAFNDAFINTRRIGINAGYVNKAGTLRGNVGLFAAHSIDQTFDNDGWIAAARGVWSPLWNGNQMHFGLNFQPQFSVKCEWHAEQQRGQLTFRRPGRALSRTALQPADRRPLRRHGQLRRAQ
jgi:phosphate-selective porin OprO/OprP